uniref:Uncharacterized protein n=1 Tax=Oryza brachyantha TaxID=4533 RepID=J3LMY9_ORYBR
MTHDVMAHLCKRAIELHYLAITGRVANFTKKCIGTRTTSHFCQKSSDVRVTAYRTRQFVLERHMRLAGGCSEARMRQSHAEANTVCVRNPSLPTWT